MRIAPPHHSPLLAPTPPANTLTHPTYAIFPTPWYANGAQARTHLYFADDQTTACGHARGNARILDHHHTTGTGEPIDQAHAPRVVTCSLCRRWL